MSRHHKVALRLSVALTFAITSQLSTLILNAGTLRATRVSAVHAASMAASARCPASEVHGVGQAAWVGDDILRAWTIWQGPRASLDVNGLGVPKRPYGQKVLWLVHRSLNQAIRLRGWNLRTGKSVWFQFADQGAGTQRVGARAVLDPRYSNANNAQEAPDWRGYSSAIMLPSSGCYVLYAEWPGGSWLTVFSGN